MKQTILFATFITVTASISAFAVESAFDRELKQLTEQRDKAAAAALEPINKRYHASLELLLKRATQANALDDAIKIREALGTPSGAAAGPTTAATTSKTGKLNLQRKLTGTQWTGDGKNYVGYLRFESKGVVWTKAGGGATANVGYEIADDGTVHFKIGPADQVLTLAADFKTLTLGDSTFTRK